MDMMPATEATRVLIFSNLYHLIQSLFVFMKHPTELVLLLLEIR